MSDSLTLLHGADARLQQLVDKLDDTALAAQTPCHGWDARSLVSHTLQSVEAFSAAVDGGPGPTEAELFGGADILGSDPVGVTKRIFARSHEAWGGVQDWEGTLTTVFGPLPAGQAVAVITFSTLVHSWDLAKALGEQVEFSAEEAGLVEAVGGIVVPMLRPQGLFADEVDVPADATPTQRVVAYTGRSPL